jgi:Spy/CpxP family protein refolding chaperone
MRKMLIAVIAMAFVTPVLAQEEPPPIVEASRNAVVAFLDLTPEQVEDWHQIYQIHREAEQPLQEAIAEVQAAIDELFAAGEPEEAAVGALFIERRALTEELVKVHVTYHEDFVLILDDAQARKLRFIARADDVQKFIPAFKLFELIPRR